MNIYKSYSDAIMDDGNMSAHRLGALGISDWAPLLKFIKWKKTTLIFTMNIWKLYDKVAELWKIWVVKSKIYLHKNQKRKLEDEQNEDVANTEQTLKKE